MSYILGMVSLTAVETQGDTFGADDTYMLINSDQVFSHDFEAPQTEWISMEPRVITSDATVYLYDSDGFWEGSDDFLGQHDVVNPGNDPIGVRIDHTADIIGGGSVYELAYYTINLGNISV